MPFFQKKDSMLNFTSPISASPNPFFKIPKFQSPISHDRKLTSQTSTSPSIQRSGDPPTRTWTERYQALQARIHAGNVRRSDMGYMLIEAILAANTPSPLVARTPTTRDLRFVNSINRSQTIQASTFASDAFNHRNNYWRWMAFTPRAISETKAYTISIIEHELQHCADIKVDLTNYLAGAGPHTEQGFVAYTQTRSNSAMRHMHVYADQAAPSKFAQWSQNERLDWLGGALGAMPLNVGASTSLPIERRVNRFYQTASPARKSQIVRMISSLVFDDLSGDHSSPQYREAYQRAQTALNHFQTVWRDNTRIKQSLLGYMRRNQPTPRH